MSTKTIQLSNLDQDARGRRYTVANREAAYLVWKIAAKRSFTKAAEVTGIAVNTIRSWHDQDDWATRVAAEDRETIEMVRVGLATAITDQTERSLDVLIQIRDDASAPHKVRLDAAVTILNIAGVSTRVPSGPSAKPVEPHPLPPPIVRVITPAEQIATGERLARAVAALTA